MTGILTTNETAERLFQDVLDNPSEDGPRLVLADWLEDHGAIERAEFIRVQCEIARLLMEPIVETIPRRNGPPVQRQVGNRFVDVQRAEELHRREQELVDGVNLALWAGLFPCAVLPENGTIWRRGFIEEITVSWQFWQEYAETIRASTPLRKVKLTTMPENFAPIEFVYNAPSDVVTSSAFPGIEFQFEFDNSIRAGRNTGPAAIESGAAVHFDGETIALADTWPTE